MLRVDGTRFEAVFILKTRFNRRVPHAFIVFAVKHVFRISKGAFCFCRSVGSHLATLLEQPAVFLLLLVITELHLVVARLFIVQIACI